MTEEERNMANELAQIKLRLRILQRDTGPHNPDVLDAISEACDRLQFAIESLSSQTRREA